MKLLLDYYVETKNCINVYECEELICFDLCVQHYLLMTMHFLKQLESSSNFAISGLGAP